MASNSQRASKRPKRAAALSARGWVTRRNAVLAWWVALLWFAAINLYPVSSGLTRSAGVLLAGLLAIGLLGLWWRYRFLRWSLLVLYTAVGIFAVLPGRSGYDREALRLETTRALQRYRGGGYYWGGEGFLGIDCSGLVRRGAIDAMALYGIRTANPLLVRKAIALWWHDMSAEELGRGASGLAEKEVAIKAIAGTDESKLHLHPGDFAISENGTHALAYLGNRQWIEADPTEGRVIELNASSGKQNPWFHQGMVILRWRHLELEKAVGRR